VALYYLWLTGETMIHHRHRFERVYASVSGLVPSAERPAVTRAGTEAFFARKIAACAGAISEGGWRENFNDALQIRLSRDQARRKLDRWVRTGLLSRIEVDGAKESLFVLTSDIPLLRELEAGEAPAEWRPLETTTDDEAVFLAPLDIVSARGRAKRLFDFDYVWEVYKPASGRRWGYYTLPILMGDRLVGRLDPWMVRETATLEIRGFWLEPGVAPDESLAGALGGGMIRFADFLGARQVDLKGIFPRRLRSRLQEAVEGKVEVAILPRRRKAPKAFPR
jgi:uncharacterized protein YcaQ